MDKIERFQGFVKNLKKRNDELKGKGLTFEEIVNGVKNGSIKIHTGHHNEQSIRKGKVEIYFIKQLEQDLKRRNSYGPFEPT